MFEFLIELLAEILFFYTPRIVGKWIKWLCYGRKKPMDKIKKESGNTLLGVFALLIMIGVIVITNHHSNTN